MNRQNLEEYLEWLITPSTDREDKIFKEKNLVDDYISIKYNIKSMTNEELMDEIDRQIAHTNSSLNREDFQL